MGCGGCVCAGVWCGGNVGLVFLVGVVVLRRAGVKAGSDKSGRGLCGEKVSRVGGTCVVGGDA